LIEIAGPVEVRLRFGQSGPGLVEGGAGLQVGRFGGVGIRTLERNQRLAPCRGVSELDHHFRDAAGYREKHSRNPALSHLDLPWADYFFGSGRCRGDGLHANLLELGRIGRDHSLTGRGGGGRWWRPGVDVVLSAAARGRREECAQKQEVRVWRTLYRAGSR